MSADEYSRVFRKAERSSDRLFTVLTRSNQTGRPRLGLAISKKSVRSAVGRNRIKRVIRESFRVHKFDLPDVDIVVLSKQGISNATKAQLADSVKRHWSKLQQR